MVPQPTRRFGSVTQRMEYLHIEGAIDERNSIITACERAIPERNKIDARKTIDRHLRLRRQRCELQAPQVAHRQHTPEESD